RLLGKRFEILDRTGYQQLPRFRRSLQRRDSIVDFKNDTACKLMNLFESPVGSRALNLGYHGACQNQSHCSRPCCNQKCVPAYELSGPINGGRRPRRKRTPRKEAFYIERHLARRLIALSRIFRRGFPNQIIQLARNSGLKIAQTKRALSPARIED